MAKNPVRVLGDQIGSKVVETAEGTVLKRGWRVREAEFEAMNLVAKHTSVPIAAPIRWDSQPKVGQITMTLVPGVCLKELWDSLSSDEKSSICEQVWGFVEQLKTMPKPLHLQHLYQCTADGKLGNNPFVAKNDRVLNRKESDILSETILRKRICDNYYDHNGRRYTKEQLFDMLPWTGKTSVFTHGELIPKNIMVSGAQVTAILDWETAGWFPEYWEQIALLYMRGDWKDYMLACAPQTWNLDAFRAAKRVLLW